MGNPTSNIDSTNTYSDLFYKYLDAYRGKVKSKSSEGYYHVDIVADAYSQGFKDGKESGEKDFIKNLFSNKIEEFTQKSNQIYILSKRVISLIQEKGYSASGLYINLSFDRPSVIISIPNEHLNNDNFVEIVYSKINDNRKIYSKLFDDVLDIGLVSSENLEESILEDDGFGYKENY